MRKNYKMDDYGLHRRKISRKEISECQVKNK
jgi:hypothetical protein